MWVEVDLGPARFKFTSRALITTRRDFGPSAWPATLAATWPRPMRKVRRLRPKPPPGCALGPARDTARKTFVMNRGIRSPPFARGRPGRGWNRSSSATGLNPGYRTAAGSGVPVPPYPFGNQDSTTLTHTRAKKCVWQKPLCRHRLDAATVPRPFILPCVARTQIGPSALFTAAIFCTNDGESAIDSHIISITKSTKEEQRP
jgi:hypothetical protein